MPKYVAAIDQGTTSTRFIIFDHGGNVIAVDQKEHQQIYPKPGWVEHDPLEIWENTRAVMNGALQKSGLQSADIAAIGVTNQRETTVVWDKNTGKPIYNAIVWQDTRTDVICNELARTADRIGFGTKQVCLWLHISPARKLNGFSIMWMAHAPKLKRGSCYLAILTRGSFGI